MATDNGIVNATPRVAALNEPLMPASSMPICVGASEPNPTGTSVESIAEGGPDACSEWLIRLSLRIAVPNAKPARSA